MKCNICGSEWQVPNSVGRAMNNCPFCNAPLKPQKNTVRDTFRWIVQTKGEKVLLQSGIINSILADMCKSESKERYRIKQALTAGVGADFYRIWLQSGGNLHEDNIQAFEKSIVEDKELAESLVEYVVKTLIYAVQANEQQEATIEETSLDTEIEIITSNDNDSKVFYIKGLECFKNQKYEEALSLFIRSAENGNLKAYSVIGWMYQYGEGVHEDYHEAFKWFKTGADRDDSEAQECLGYMYSHGLGVKQDHQEAVKWYRLSANQDNAVGQNNLGAMFFYGNGVKQDYTEALKWFRLASDNGYALSMVWLGYMYSNGFGVKQDYSEALHFFMKAAEMGVADAQYNIANLYYSGLGVKQDYNEAVKWYRKAADKGYSQEYSDIGYIYQYGLGVEQDEKEAMKWYSKPAEKGNPEAQCELGTMYKNGLGIAQDYNEAMRWFRLSADQGETRAQFNIGYMFEMGMGVKPDKDEAIKWYSKAAKQGNEKAKERLLTFPRLQEESKPQKCEDLLAGSEKEYVVQNNSDGSVTEGYKINGVWEGEFIKTFENGAYFKGTYVSGKTLGELIYVDSDGLSKVGTWYNGNWNGKCRKENSDNSVTEGFLKDGVWSGSFTKTYVNGAIYKGTYVNGEIEGELTYIDECGNTFICEWHNDNWNGEGIYHSGVGVLTGKWIDGEVAGKGIYKYDNGSIYEGGIKNFLREGKGVVRFPLSDIVINAVFKENAVIGSATILFPGGDTYVGSWKEGIDGHGTFTSIRCMGLKKITYTGDWKDGMLSGSSCKLTIVPNNGSTIIYEGDFSYGKADGNGYLYECEQSGHKEPIVNGEWKNNELVAKSKSRFVKKGEGMIASAVEYIWDATSKLAAY